MFVVLYFRGNDTEKAGRHNYSIGYFISPHGFGYAALASAVMVSMHDINPSIRFEIFTTIPEWFFLQSLSGPFTYHSSFAKR
ncbi:MAG: hypothetical protein ACE5GV_05910 [Candidatus Scalindua sp.]